MMRVLLYRPFELFELYCLSIPIRLLHRSRVVGITSRRLIKSPPKFIAALEDEQLFLVSKHMIDFMINAIDLFMNESLEEEIEVNEG